MDIKAKIEELVKKISGDKALQEKFQKDPLAAVQSLIGVDIPADQLAQIVSGVQAKLGNTKAGGLLGKIKGLFGK